MYKGYRFIPYYLYRLNQKKTALVKVSASALKELTSVDHYVRFFICYMGTVIAMSYRAVTVNTVIYVMCSAAVVKTSKMGSSP